MIVFQLVHSVSDRALKIRQITRLFFAVRRNHRSFRVIAQNGAYKYRKIDVLSESESLLSAKGWG